MRKLFLTAMVAVITMVSVNAQTQFGAKAGLNIATLGGDVENVDAKLGLNIGVFAEIEIADKLIFQPELVYSMQGAKGEESEMGYSYESKLKLDYLNVPLMFKYYVVDGFALEAGPQVGFLLSAKDDYEESYEGVTESGEYDMKDDLKSIDFGLNFGASYDISEKIIIGARYNLGLSDINDQEEEYDDVDFKIKNNVFSFSVGYRF